MNTRQTFAQILASHVVAPSFPLTPPSAVAYEPRQVGGFTQRPRTGAILLPGTLDQ